MRLTKHMRGVIASRVLDKTFKDREARLAERDAVLATRVVVAAYGADVWDRIEALPDGWLPVVKHILASIGSERVLNLTFRDFWPLPTEVAHGRIMLSLAGNEAILDEYHEIAADRNAIKAQREQLKAEVYAVLNSVTTAERLAEVWPEGLAELPPEWLTPRSVPAPLVEDLNKRIALLREVA